MLLIISSSANTSHPQQSFSSHDLSFVLSCQYTCNPVSSSWYLSDMITHLLSFLCRFSDFVLSYVLFWPAIASCLSYTLMIVLCLPLLSLKCVLQITFNLPFILYTVVLAKYCQEILKVILVIKTTKMHITEKDKADYLHVFCSSTFSSWTSAIKIVNILEMWYANLLVLC